MLLRIEADGDSYDASLTFVVEGVHELSMNRLVAFLVGAMMFAYAPLLALSTAFHLTAGSLGCVLLSAIVVVFVVWRNVPYRRSLVAMVTMWGGAAAVIWKVVSAVHASALDRAGGSLLGLLLNPFVVAYVGVSGLVGMAVTYYVHDAGNVKMNRIVQVALQLCGVGLMVGSATTWVGGGVWCGVVVGWRWRSGVGRRVARETARKTMTRNLGTVAHSHPPALELDFSGAYEDAFGGFGVANGARAGMPGSSARHGAQRTPTAASGGTRAPEYAHEEDRTPSTPTVFQVTTTRGVPPSPTDFPEAEQARLHSLVRRGKVLNVETDRTIAIGKSKYNELFLKGYEVDFEQGTITPPSTRSRRGSFRG